MRFTPQAPAGIRVASARLLALLVAWGWGAAGMVPAQFMDPPLYTGNPANQVMARGAYDLEGFLFRVHHHTEGYGEEAGKTAFGLSKTLQFDQFALFADGSYRIDDDGNSSASGGGGVRFLYADWLAGSERILGANFWYDCDDQDRFYEQLGLGLESLGDRWDFRVNANIPLGRKEFQGERTFLTRTLRFREHHLVQDFLLYRESAMHVVEAEAARRLGQRNIWAFGGGYYLDGGGKQAVGGKAGLRGYAAQDLALSLTISHDPVFDTTVMFGLSWFFDLTARGRARMAPATMADRLREPVQRNDYVAVWKRWDRRTQTFTDADGHPLYFVHADSNAAAGGDGTFETPFATLLAAQNGSSPGNYIFLHSDSVFEGQSITLKNSQKLLGDGVAGGHQVVTSERGTVRLPSVAGDVPVIRNAPGTAVALADHNLVSGIRIEGGVHGIAGTNNATIDRVAVEETTGYALNLQNAAGNLVINKFTYNGGAIGTGGIRISGLTGTATITDASIQGGAGPGLTVVNGQGTVNVADFAYNGGATSTAGMSFDNADGTYNFNRVALAGGQAGVQITNGSDGTFTFANTDITNPAGTAFRVDGGTANVNFTGKIVQANNAPAVSVTGAHTGTLTFTPKTAGDNVVETTGGTGLQFDDADGVYTFGRIALNGGAEGIRVANSSGEFTFESGTIAGMTGTAVTVEGGSANVSVGTTINNDTGRSVVVTGISGGEVDFGAAVTDTGLGVLVEDNTGGTVYFAKKLTLNTGTNDAITLTNNTGAIVAFQNLDINTTSGQGFVASLGGQIAVLGPDATIATTTGIGLNLNGVEVHASGIAFDSISVDGADHGILLADVTGATISVGSGGTDPGDGGTLANTADHAASVTDTTASLSLNYMNITGAAGDALHFDNADGTYAVNEVAITGGAGGVNILNGSGGTFNFTDTTITDPNGVAFSVDGGSANVDFTGKITQTANNFAAVSVTGNHTGTVSFAPATDGDDVIEASTGPGLVFNSADGTYTFGQIALSGDSAIGITDSDGNFTFNDGTITNPTITAVHVNGGAANVYVGATIENDAGYSAVVENKTGGTVIFAGDVTDTGSGVLVQDNTGGSVQFTGHLALNTVDNDAVTLLNNAGASISFSDLAIDTTGGTGQGFVATGGGTITVTGADNTIATADGIGLRLDGVAIGAGGMNFKSISVDGADYGLLLADVTGGTITVGAGGSAAGDGGALANTQFDAVSATNVAGLSLNYMNITSAGGDGVNAANVGTLTLNHVNITDATGDGVHVVHNNASASTVTINETEITGAGGQAIELAANGTGAMTLNVTDSTIDSTAGAEGILVNVGNPATQVSLTFTDNSVTAGDASALALNAGGIQAKTVTMLADRNTFDNDSNAATVAVLNDGQVTLNATVTNNALTNGTGNAFEMETNAGAAVVRLNLNGNEGAGGGANAFELTNTAGTFGAYDRDELDNNNNGGVGLNGAIDNLGAAP